MAQINNLDYTTFGGTLSQFDFDGHHTLSSMADKIESDFRFDKKCKKDSDNKKNNLQRRRIIK